jgi:hypothetical protein
MKPDVRARLDIHAEAFALDEDGFGVVQEPNRPYR